MRLSSFLLVFSMLYGCMPNQSLGTSAVAETNVCGLSRLEKGMTQADVLKIMRHPYSDTVFHFDTDTYDVWFYVTGPAALGQSRLMPMNLTPLTFKNGILIGWGYAYVSHLNKLQEETEKAKQAPKPEKIGKETEPENKELEKVLKESFVPQQQAAPQSPPPTPSQKPGEAPIPPSKEQPLPSQKGQAPSKKPLPSQKEPPAQPTQQTPNWEPLEKQSPPPPPARETKQGSSTLSMSKKPKENPASKQEEPPTQKPKEKVPLDENDEEMFQEERDQDFNQT